MIIWMCYKTIEFVASVLNSFLYLNLDNNCACGADLCGFCYGEGDGTCQCTDSFDPRCTYADLTLANTCFGKHFLNLKKIKTVIICLLRSSCIIFWFCWSYSSGTLALAFVLIVFPLFHPFRV